MQTTKGRKLPPNQQDPSSFSSLVEVVRRLRQDCPWDRAQTQESLTSYILEEAYELVEAIEKGDQNHIREELGDFLFQVLLQAQVAFDEGHFDLQSVMTELRSKLVERHPHVFSPQTGEAITQNQVWKNWHALKQKKSPGIRVPVTLPALLAAHKIGIKSKGYRFDWKSASGVFRKLSEELDELKKELSKKKPHKDRVEDELGDVLFTLAQLARHCNLEAERAARKANQKFLRRFHRALQEAQARGENFQLITSKRREHYWMSAKQLEKQQRSKRKRSPSKQDR